MRKYLILLLFLASCGECPERVPPYTMQQFTGREEQLGLLTLVRRPVYRAKVPSTWQRVDTVGSLLDTKRPNVSFVVEEGLTVSVHTFPSEALESRIPPAAQVARWNRQTTGFSQPITQGGFAGLRFEAPTVLAWSLQLDMEHYQTLTFLAHTEEEREHYKQICADYTIKASGPAELIEKHRDEIELFAHSFELIQDLPRR